MKKLIVFCIVFLSAQLSANNFNTDQSHPPGTMRLEPSKTGIEHAEYIDESVITISNWLVYLHWTRMEYGTQSAEYIDALPDSVILQKSLPYPSWRHPSFSTYAMVGISYEQAMKYCIWRTHMVNELFERTGVGYTVSYSLPTETDFEEAYRQKKNITLNIGANVHELTAGKAVLHIEQTGALNFQPYLGPDAIIGFRCVAEIINR